MKKNIKSGFWFCPLYKKEISEGLCLDINYERLEYFKSEVLKGTMKQLQKSREEINHTCEHCPVMYQMCGWWLGKNVIS